MSSLSITYVTAAFLFVKPGCVEGLAGLAGCAEVFGFLTVVEGLLYKVHDMSVSPCSTGVQH